MRIEDGMNCCAVWVLLCIAVSIGYDTFGTVGIILGPILYAGLLIAANKLRYRIWGR